MRILVVEMEEQILDIDNTIRVLLNTRRRLMLLDAGYSEEMLDGDLYRNLKSLKQKVYYRDNVIKEKDLKIQANEKRIMELENEIILLKQASGKISRPIATSINSSVPPSKNPIGIKHTKSLREPSTKPVGGQKGHAGTTRPFIDMPDEVEICQAPPTCPSCGTNLDEFSHEMGEIRQMIDIPAIIVPTVTQYVQMKTTCKCGHCSKGEFPQKVIGTVCYGPNIEATVAYLSTLQDIPFKRLSHLMENLFGVQMSQGTISNILTRMRKKAGVAYEKIRVEVEHSSVVGGDETGMKVNGKNNWMWTFQTDMATYLVIDSHRGKSVIDTYFPDGFPNSTLVSDRLSAYFSVETQSHQICLAHLIRNTNFFYEYIPEHDWPKRMLDLLRESIHERKENGISVDKEEIFKLRFDKLMDEAVELKDSERQKIFNSFRKGLVKHRENIFTFLINPLVPYDNNASERALRPTKTKIKVSGQFKTIEGAQNYATLQSIIQTAKKNNQNPMDALIAVARYSEE